MESFAGCPQAAAFLVKQFAIGFSLCRQMLAVLHYLIEKSLSTEIYTRGSDFHILFCVTLKAQWSETPSNQFFENVPCRRELHRNCFLKKR